MNVVYVSSDEYARHMGVSLYSLLDNNQDMEEICVFVLSTGIRKDTAERLHTIAGKFGRELQILDLTDLKQRIGFDADTGKFNISTLGRLFAGDVLPDNVDRVLYLDCDTVVLRSLKRLWETDLHGKLLGAVPEPTIYPAVKHYLGLTAEDPFYNCGVLLMDLKAWKEEKTGSKVLAYYRNIYDVCLFQDQDAMNGALRGRFRPVSPAFNFFTNYRYFRYSVLVKKAPWYRIIPERTYHTAKHHPAIIHFAGDERPWKTGSLNHYGRAYDHYLRLTPFRDCRKEKGSEGKMFLYHMMDWMTFLFPGIREEISKAYFHKMEKDRKAKHA